MISLQQPAIQLSLLRAGRERGREREREMSTTLTHTRTNMEKNADVRLFYNTTLTHMEYRRSQGGLLQEAVADQEALEKEGGTVQP